MGFAFKSGFGIHLWLIPQLFIEASFDQKGEFATIFYWQVRFLLPKVELVY